MALLDAENWTREEYNLVLGCLYSALIICYMAIGLYLGIPERFCYFLFEFLFFFFLTLAVCKISAMIHNLNQKIDYYANRN